MSAYLRGLLIGVIVCRLVLLLAPDIGGDLKKCLKYLCSLVILITVITPLLNGCDRQEEITDAIQSFFSPTKEEAATASREDLMIEGTIKETAYAIMTHIGQQYGISAENIKVTVLTTEVGELPTVEEIQIYLYNASPADRNSIRREIEDMIGVSTFVFGREKS